MSKRIIGILGGLGPATSAEFYQEIVARPATGERPAVCLWSLPLILRKEAEYISAGKHREYYRRLLVDGARVLERAGSTEIVIPCNTVHEFHAAVASAVRVPVPHLVELVADEAARRGWRSAVVLATSQTRRTRLYQRALASRGVASRFPSADDQRALDRIIRGLLGDDLGPALQDRLADLVARAGGTDADGVILGCTDLQLAFLPNDRVVDSLRVLAAACRTKEKAGRVRVGLTAIAKNGMMAVSL